MHMIVETRHFKYCSMVTIELGQHLDDLFTVDEQLFLRAVLIETTPRRLCRLKQCYGPADGYGYCATHSKVCRIEGCTNRLQSRGRCFRHGGAQRCKAKNCAKSVQRNGFCIAHGGQLKVCSVDKCDRRIRARGRCFYHDKIFRSSEASVNHR